MPAMSGVSSSTSSIKPSSSSDGRLLFTMEATSSALPHAQVCLGEIPLHLKMRKAYLTDVTELETLLPDASAANRALELLGRELNLFTEKKEVGKPATLPTWLMKS